LKSKIASHNKAVIHEAGKVSKSDPRNSQKDPILCGITIWVLMVILIWVGCYNKITMTGWLKQQIFTVLEVSHRFQVESIFGFW
jgi:hypothetical protein